MLSKPTTKLDLIPPFQAIGEPGWDVQLQAILRAYDLPLPPALPEHHITAYETALNITLPSSMRLFLSTFGPVDFDDPHLLGLGQFERISDIWFKELLPPQHQPRLGELLAFATTSSDNVYALELTTYRCCRCCHDPPSLDRWLPSFDAFIHYAVINLSWSYYGWPDPEIEQMAVELTRDLYGW